MSGKKCTEFEIRENERIRQEALSAVRKRLAEVAELAAKARDVCAAQDIPYAAGTLPQVSDNASLAALTAHLSQIQKVAALAEAARAAASEKARSVVAAHGARVAEGRIARSEARMNAASRLEQLAAQNSSEREAQLNREAAATVQVLVDELNLELLGLEGAEVEAARAELASATAAGSAPTDLDRRVRATAEKARRESNQKFIADTVLEVFGDLFGVSPGFQTGEPQTIATSKRAGVTLKFDPATGNVEGTPVIIQRPGEQMSLRERQALASQADVEVCDALKAAERAMSDRGVGNRTFHAQSLRPDEIQTITVAQASPAPERARRANVLPGKVAP